LPFTYSWKDGLAWPSSRPGSNYARLNEAVEVASAHFGRRSLDGDLTARYVATLGGQRRAKRYIGPMSDLDMRHQCAESHTSISG
jgi:hypothetical protein